MADTHGSSEEEWIGFDLDGTLAKYDGWKGIAHIGDPVPRMTLIARLLHHLGKKIKILTARVAPRTGRDDSEKAREYVQKWCEKNLGFSPEITYVKDASMVALFDDRAVAVEPNSGKVLGGWPDALPKASDKAKKAVMKMEKKSEGRLPKADLQRIYDILQADARLSNRLSGLGFGRTGDAYRQAAIKLKVMELANVLRDGKRTRNRIVHTPGYVPSEQDALRALRQYADADSRLNERLGEQYG